MSDSDSIFHLAIPCRNLDEAADFYVGGLCCRLARRYDDRITLDFFGDQVVCHLAPDFIDREPRMYPRHFGITFTRKADYEEILNRARTNGLAFFQDSTIRFEGRGEEHHTFFLIDPSNNLIEFKYYNNPDMRY